VPRVARASVLVVWILVAALASCTREIASRQPSCESLGSDPPLPAADLVPGRVFGATGGMAQTVHPVTAWRDPSVTIVGYCAQPSHEKDIPTLLHGAVEFSPFGGVLVQQHEIDVLSYAYYPPTRGRRFSLALDGSLVGSVTFSRFKEIDCSLRAQDPFRVLACGALVLVEWDSRIPLSADEAGPVDLSVMERGSSIDLGFYFLGFGNGDHGLSIRFGFRRPSASELRVELNSVFRRVGLRDRMFPINARLRKPVNLVLTRPR
jgi:hypothetical protein